jgi:hypothetical protein
MESAFRSHCSHGATKLIPSVLPALTVTRTHRRRPAMIKKVLTWLGIAFLIFFIAFNPNSAADVFSSLGGTIADIARGFGTFFTNLVA